MKEQIKNGWKWVILPSALLLVMVMAVAAAARSGLPADAAASVEGVVITKEAVDRRIQIGVGINPTIAPVPGSSELEELRRLTAEQMVSEELERQEAQKRGITVSADEIDTMIDQLIEDKYLSNVEKMEADFAAKGVSQQDVREEILRRLVHQKLLDSLEQEVPVSEEEARAEYDSHIDSYVFPERRQMRQIFVPDEASARSAYQRIQSGEDFANVSSLVSIDDKLRRNSGMLGLVSRASLPADIGDAGFSLELNAVSAPFSSEGGWSILKVEFIAPASSSSFDEKKEELMEYMGSQRLGEHYQKYVEETYASYDIEYADGYAPVEETVNT